MTASERVFTGVAAFEEVRDEVCVRRRDEMRAEARQRMAREKMKRAVWPDESRSR